MVKSRENRLRVTGRIGYGQFKDRENRLQADGKAGRIGYRSMEKQGE